MATTMPLIDKRDKFQQIFHWELRRLSRLNPPNETIQKRLFLLKCSGSCHGNRKVLSLAKGIVNTKYEFLLLPYLFLHIQDDQNGSTYKRWQHCPPKFRVGLKTNTYSIKNNIARAQQEVTLYAAEM